LKGKRGLVCKGLPRRSGREATGPVARVAGGKVPLPGSASGAANVTIAPEVRPDSEPPVTVGTARDSYRDAARRAYQMRAIPWAIYYYRAHLVQAPQDTEALGELGNIYYQAGNLTTAAALFYDAASLLLQRGQREAASRLLLAISEGNPALADELYPRLLAPAH
jgi:hypothetical protein